MDFVTIHFGKMNLWPVEHFYNIFVLTFGWVCYCTQQTHPKVRTKLLKKCSTGQRFIFPKWIVTKSILKKQNHRALYYLNITICWWAWFSVLFLLFNPGQLGPAQARRGKLSTWIMFCETLIEAIYESWSVTLLCGWYWRKITIDLI